uniref:uncharacterized protein LOC128388527 n=1 Tax=Panonychus citri TaxID=50023 RepID=UPI0023072AA4|nr:uncharacterized protein LOC128388527 [Panonychus citri]
MDLQLKTINQINGNTNNVKTDCKLKVNHDDNGNLKVTAIKHGMSVITTILFVAGENAGAGLLALPSTLNKSGWWGLPLMVMIIFDSAVAASLIGKCWLILEERWPQEYQLNCRNPYPEIGKMAFGPRMKSMVTIMLQVTLIGTSAVLLLVCAQLSSDLIDRNHSLSYGLWILIIAFGICPFMWLGTPVEFWPAAAIALGTSTIAVLLLLFEIGRDLASTSYDQLPIASEVNLSTISLAFGSFMFASGGTGPFPTYQNDMRDKSKWTRAVVIGFTVLFFLLTPLPIMGYLAYGSTVSTNIIHSIPIGMSRDIVAILMAGHLFFAFLLMINPAVQEIEDKFNVPHTFNWKRVVIRVTMLFLIVFICESIPRFGKILDLIGGSTMNCLAYIFPPLFYIRLCSMKNPSWPERKISTVNKLYFYKIVLIGVIGGICSTVSATLAILGPNAFVLPCYLDLNCTNE